MTRPRVPPVAPPAPRPTCAGAHYRVDTGKRMMRPTRLKDWKGQPRQDERQYGLWVCKRCGEELWLPTEIDSAMETRDFKKILRDKVWPEKKK